MSRPEVHASDGPKVNDWRPTAPVGVLRRRAELVAQTRAFFTRHGLLEVDIPVLQGGANLDHGVIPMRLDQGRTSRFLPTSPEHPLKRLVAAGCGDVWALAPAFRLDERGQRHAPEFRMLEWYRLGWDERQLATETIALLAELTGRDVTQVVLTWREAYLHFVGIDPVTASDAEIVAHLGADAAVAAGDRRVALDLLLTRDIEPHLGRDAWTILSEYPADQCAQARIRLDTRGLPVAARFEIYRDGVELANGYHELLDGSAMAERMSHELRQRANGEHLDERFLAAMAHGLPDCAGVAVGFDRVVMLALGLSDIEQVQAFGWNHA